MPDPVPADRIPTKTDSAARRRYRVFLQKSLSAVDGTAQWLLQRVPGESSLWTMTTVPAIISLKKCTSHDRLYLRATQRFSLGAHPRYEGERKVVTQDYAYTLSDSADQRPEMYSWQWTHEVAPPHVHIGRGNPSLGSLGKLHIPTGRVAFEQILKFAIEEHDVQTAIDRADAIRDLDECLRRFVTFRTWA